MPGLKKSFRIHWTYVFDFNFRVSSFVSEFSSMMQIDNVWPHLGIAWSWQRLKGKQILITWSFTFSTVWVWENSILFQDQQAHFLVICCTKVLHSLVESIFLWLGNLSYLCNLHLDFFKIKLLRNIKLKEPWYRIFFPR